MLNMSLARDEDSMTKIRSVREPTNSGERHPRLPRPGRCSIKTDRAPRRPDVTNRLGSVPRGTAGATSTSDRAAVEYRRGECGVRIDTSRSEGMQMLKFILGAMVIASWSFASAESFSVHPRNLTLYPIK